jgi:glycosyltransferase involved in cell wall biosynthesis
MRVGILSYPMLFQREGGLQIQVRETIAALRRLETAGCPLEVELVDANRDRLSDYDVIHVFPAINGNHRIVEAASEQGLPVVLSPLVSPAWCRSAGWRARLAERVTGRLTTWDVQTSYAQTRRALQLAQCVIALGEAERDAIVAAFQVDAARIRILPNGISAHFFTADAALFQYETGIAGPFVLMVGAISPYKNQLGLVKALTDCDVPIVIIGRPLRHDIDYLQRLLQLPHVTWLGQLQHGHPLLASAYAAAAVLALPSQGEVFPLTVLEALAAGTPVVMTTESALQLPDAGFALKKVRWDDGAGQRRAILGLLAERPLRADVSALVRQFTWEKVAAKIADCYAQLAGEASHRAV